MYAIIETGSKQYKVGKDDILDIELLESPKEEVKFDKIILFSDGEKFEVGTPYVKGAHVTAKVLSAMIKDDKVTSFKYKSKTNYHRTIGHRQRYTRIQIQDIKAGGHAHGA